MNDELISIIVPVYNVKDFLEQCVNSILSQSYENLEVILVDDGSTDGSENLCDKLKSKDTRIKVIHKTNGGLSDARNAALDIFTGKYVMFVDSDDWIDLDCCKVLYNTLKKNCADIVSCRYRNIYPDGKLEPIGEDHSVVVYDGLNCLKEFLYGKIVDPFAWAKLYKREIIGSLRFIKGITGEDIPFNLEIFKTTSKMVVVGESYYNYRQQRVGSICHAAVSKKRIDSAFRWEQIHQDCLKNYPELEKYVLRRQVLFYIGLYNRIILGKQTFPEVVTHILQFIELNNSDIMKSDINEKTVKIASWLLSKSPFLYGVVMRGYKNFRGEARL